MKRYKHFLALVVLFICSMLNAQLPVNDSAWVKQNSLSEEFAVFPDTVNRWWPRFSYGPISNGAEVCLGSNLYIADTVLVIRADSLTIPRLFPCVHDTTVDSCYYTYSGGTLMSRSADYGYGYMEIKAKYPTGNYAYWPAFWFFRGGCGSPDWYEEIDACENGSEEAYHGDEMGTNWHVYTTAPTIPCTSTGSVTLDAGFVVDNLPNLSLSYNKFAIEWRPGMIKWYFNDELVRTAVSFGSASIPSHQLFAMLSFGISPWYTANSWNTGASQPHQFAGAFPAYLKIDYFRYYKLNTTGCGTDQLISCPINSSTVRGVRRSITTDNTCTPTFNTSSNITLRATDFILLDVGTTINDNGSGYFSTDIIPCPD